MRVGVRIQSTTEDLKGEPSCVVDLGLGIGATGGMIRQDVQMGPVRIDFGSGLEAGETMGFFQASFISSGGAAGWHGQANKQFALSMAIQPGWLCRCR